MSEFDVFLADCPARTTLGLIGDTWSVVVLVGLGRGPQRFTVLHERIGGISKKVLVDVLRRLEAAGLVARRSLPTAPRGVEYRLTALGSSLLGPVRSLADWAEAHTGDVLAAQDTSG